MFVYCMKSRAPWGDYGHVLVHGISTHAPMQGDRIPLERTGPFIPPVTMPRLRHIILTDDARRALEGADIRGVSYRAVEKFRIARLHWETWDRSAPLSNYPRGGEPEAYVLDAPHDPATASAMGEIWQLLPEEWGDAEVVGQTRRTKKVTAIRPESTPMPDIFLARGCGYTFLSERAHEQIAGMADEWFEFERVPVT
jgi:hypothetical protein